MRRYLGKIVFLSVLFASVIFGQILKIDRAKPLNAAGFTGQANWTIAEQDQISLKFTTIDLSKIQLENCFREGEISITGEEKLKRLKASAYVLLDVQVMEAFLKNRKLIPENWKSTGNDLRIIFFDGTIFKDLNGNRYVLGMAFVNKKWDWDYFETHELWGPNDPSAVIKVEYNNKGIK